LREFYQRLAPTNFFINFGELEELHDRIENHTLVENWEVLPGQKRVRVNFAGAQADCATLLRALVESGIPITEFHCTQEDLETIFPN